MARIEKSIEIRAPSMKVWDMLTFDKIPEWEEGYRKNVKSVEYTSEVHTPEDKYRVGASAHLIVKRGKPFNVEITESLENEKITFRGDMTGEAVATYILEPIEVGTKVTYVVDFETPWGIIGKIIERLLQGQGERDIERSLERLKSILEK